MMGETVPDNAVATGGIYELKDGRANPDTVNAILYYPGAWNLSFESTVRSVRGVRPTVLFLGTDGTLDIARDGYVFTPNKGQPESVPASGSLTTAHVKSFLDAVVNGKKPSAPIEIGISSCHPVQLAIASYWSGQRMRFNSDKTAIVTS
jgi:hypothetical protein